METHAPDVERVFRLAVTPLKNVSVRDATGTGDGSWTMEGYAAVFDEETLLYDGRFFSVYEKVARGAFDDVLSRVASGDELVHFNFGHDMNTSIAATNVQGIGGLELTADSHGLRFFARVDPSDPDAVRLASKMRRGVVGQASFAFTIASEEMTTRTLDDGKEEDHYTILQVKNLYDVCACPQGAYPQTESSVRSAIAASIGRAGLDLAGLDRRASTAGVESTSSPDGAGDGGVARVNPRVAVAKAKARALRHKH